MDHFKGASAQAPGWFYNPGVGMKVVDVVVSQEMIIISSDEYAHATIKTTRSMGRGDKGFFLTYHIVNDAEKGMTTTGQLFLDHRQFLCAFGLTDYYSDSLGRQLLSQFDGDAAAGGRFFRKEAYANFPYPGTGNRYDRNLSLYLSQSLSAAVEDLLEL